MVALTRIRNRRIENGTGKTNSSQHEPGSAMTEPDDLKLAEALRNKYLTKKSDPVGLISKYLNIAWARTEVHTGAYMFDTREHVIFYALFAAMIYLICASLIHACVRLIGWISLYIM